jgi:hypothetical protein
MFTWVERGEVFEIGEQRHGDLRTDGGHLQLRHDQAQVLNGPCTTDTAVADEACCPVVPLPGCRTPCRLWSGGGWLRRGPLPENGRITITTLTHEGNAKVVATAPGTWRPVRGLVIDPLDEDQLRTLGEASQTILTIIAGPCATPRWRPSRRAGGV